MNKPEAVKMLRTFIAIDIPLPICHYLHQSGQQITADLPPTAIRWVAPDKMHLTLRFLGKTPEDRMSEVSAVLDTIISPFRPFHLHLDQLGAFPNPRRPRVIKASLAGELDILMALQSQIEAAVHGLGWQREKRPFHPHLTLGRIKDKKQTKHISWDVRLEQKEFLISAVNLIESQLRPSGPIYTIRHSSHLTE